MFIHIGLIGLCNISGGIGLHHYIPDGIGLKKDLSLITEDVLKIFLILTTFQEPGPLGLRKSDGLPAGCFQLHCRSSARHRFCGGADAAVIGCGVPDGVSGEGIGLLTGWLLTSGRLLLSASGLSARALGCWFLL